MIITMLLKLYTYKYHQSNKNYNNVTILRRKNYGSNPKDFVHYNLLIKYTWTDTIHHHFIECNTQYSHHIQEKGILSSKSHTSYGLSSGVRRSLLSSLEQTSHSCHISPRDPHHHSNVLSAGSLSD
jgi:hypothetical protein